MPSPVSLWHQRLPAETDRLLDRAEAAAHEDLVETHARLAVDLVHIFAPRIPFDEAIDRYLESMNLEGEEAEAVGTRAVALMDTEDVTDDLSREDTRGWGFDWRYATPLGALRYIQRHRKRSAEEALWLELAAARAEEALADAHARHARGFVDILQEVVDPTRAVELYVERLKLPEMRARLVYQRVLAALAETLLPRLPDDDEAPEAVAEAAAADDGGASRLPPAEEAAEPELPPIDPDATLPEGRPRPTPAPAAGA
ncbi:MAG TPA: hypothetical protein VHG91_04200 [Longimicrobium sp.]|nr:hypothetical protein [Longimicrobium sp.]